MSQLTTANLDKLCQLAEKAAKAAGVYIQSKFDQHYETRSKVGGDSLASQVVTEVDLQAQAIILDYLKESIQTFDLGLLTEEQADDQSRLDKAYFWCIDPMDGTLPFTERRTGYAVSIALVSTAGDPVVSAVYIPDLNESYTAIKKLGIWLNNKPFERSRGIDQSIHWYMDRSFQSEPYFRQVQEAMQQWGAPIEIKADYGGVRNAIGVMKSRRGCYFKFPKRTNGCGSIWDYAATRLLFEECELQVSNAFGEKLNLNDLDTTFMNRQGILFATDMDIVKLILELDNQLKR